jgi:hypothetical protein
VRLRRSFLAPGVVCRTANNLRRPVNHRLAPDVLNLKTAGGFLGLSLSRQQDRSGQPFMTSARSP